MRIVYDQRYQRQHLEALARGIFYFGALASALDGFLTWLVVRRAGTNIERNSFMGWFMVHLGLGPTIILRVSLGVLCFWYVANLIVGRQIFMRAKRAEKYRRSIERTDRSWFSQWVIDHIPFFRAMETVFILAITWAVVGNNINAAIVFFHSH